MDKENIVGHPKKAYMYYNVKLRITLNDEYLVKQA